MIKKESVEMYVTSDNLKFEKIEDAYAHEVEDELVEYLEPIWKRYDELTAREIAAVIAADWDNFKKMVNSI